MKEIIAVAVFLSLVTGAALAADSPGTGWSGVDIRVERPRIWLDPARIDFLKAKVAGRSVDDLRAYYGTGVEGLSLVYALTGDEAAGREAVQRAMKTLGNARAVQSVALCYDWCHPLLTADERKRMADYLVDEAKKGIAFGRNWRSFHNGMYSSGLDVGLAVIAVYHDDPYAAEAMAFLQAEWEDSMKVFENLFADGEWPESFDYNRHVTYPALRFYWALKTASGVDFMAPSTHMRNTILHILHSAKPDGLVYPSNDNDWPHLGNWDREAVLLIAAEFRDPYAQHMLNHCNVERFTADNCPRWKELLWYDASIPEESPAELPMSRIFRGQGLVMGRTSWGWDELGKRDDATWFTFNCGDYYGDHQHYDVNGFQIYYKGELALDSGRYDSDWNHYNDDKLAESQFFNYYQRTIAHNTVLVHDPNEKFDMPVANDGGQRQLLFKNGRRNVPEDWEQGTFPSDDGVGTCDWLTNPGRWERGDITSYKATGDFVYVRGDGTRAYSEHKMKSFVRHFVFVRPDLFVVFDRVVSTQPEFRKTWLLHSIEEPVIAADGSSLEFSYGEGRLVCVPVLPAKRALAKVGGPGDECLVGDKHFQCGLASPVEPSELNYGELPGAWRIEESPADAAAEDYFLNVIMVTDRGSAAKPAIEVVANDDAHVVLRVASPSGRSATLTFAKGDKPAAHLEVREGDKTLFDGDILEEIVLEEGRRVFLKDVVMLTNAHQITSSSSNGLPKEAIFP